MPFCSTIFHTCFICASTQAFITAPLSFIPTHCNVNSHIRESNAFFQSHSTQTHTSASFYAIIFSSLVLHQKARGLLLTFFDQSSLLALVRQRVRLASSTASKLLHLLRAACNVSGPGTREHERTGDDRMQTIAPDGSIGFLRCLSS